jgi:hypothetical protein
MSWLAASCSCSAMILQTSWFHQNVGTNSSTQLEAEMTYRMPVGRRTASSARAPQARIRKMKMPITMMLTSQLLFPIQSRSFGIAVCARFRNSR